MAALVWDQVGDRLYETGVSKGVFFKDDRYGVPWNGLTSIEESVSNQVEPVYFDGVKFNDIVINGDFAAVLKAFTYPDEFLEYEGTLEDQTGFYIMNQPQSQFGLSYRTDIGNDVDGLQAGYKLHILYNLTALPSQKTYVSMSSATEPMEFEWELTAVPEEIENFRPTAHVVFDSRKVDPFMLEDIEDILYGGEEHDAFLPSLKGLATYIRKWDRLIVIDNGDGTWTASSPLDGVITMLDSTTFEIVTDTAVYLDADTYEIESSEKNEEDIWLP